jgi:roadblock/LC7 domain-containing protein
LAVISQLVSLQGLLDSSGANGDTLELSILNVSSESKHSRNMNIEEMAAQCCNQELSLADVDAACLFAKISRLDFFDRLAGWISVEFLDRRRDSTFCDYVADNMMPLSEWNLTDFAWSVFLAFDNGEFYHREDSRDADPVEKYTRPLSRQALVEQDES